MTAATASASGPSIPTHQQLRRTSSGGASTKLIRRVNTQDRISDILEVCALVSMELFCLLPFPVPCLYQRQRVLLDNPSSDNRLLPAHRSHALQRPSHDMAVDATALLVFLKTVTFYLLVPFPVFYSAYTPPTHPRG